jgi:hypothetical protein
MPEDDREIAELKERLASISEAVAQQELEAQRLHEELQGLQQAYQEAKEGDSWFDDATGSVFGSDEDEILDRMVEVQRQAREVQNRLHLLAEEQRDVMEELEHLEAEERAEEMLEEMVTGVEAPHAVEIAELVGDDALVAPSGSAPELDRGELTGAVDAPQPGHLQVEAQPAALSTSDDLSFGAGLDAVAAAPESADLLPFGAGAAVDGGADIATEPLPAVASFDAVHAPLALDSEVTADALVVEVDLPTLAPVDHGAEEHFDVDLSTTSDIVLDDDPLP